HRDRDPEQRPSGPRVGTEVRDQPIRGLRLAQRSLAGHRDERAKAGVRLMNGGEHRRHVFPDSGMAVAQELPGFMNTRADPGCIYRGGGYRHIATKGQRAIAAQVRCSTVGMQQTNRACQVTIGSWKVSMMIPRYARPEMAELWSDQARYATWAKVEVLATQAQCLLGRVPEQALDDIRRAAVPSAARVAEIERERDHEILSFLAAFCEGIPDDSARWVHLGMTSYDLVDTAFGHHLGAATDLLLTAVARLRRVLAEQAVKHWDTLCIGRTHGMHAEPVTFGHKLARFAFAIDRSALRLTAAREAVAVGTISGSVGTYALIDPFVEEYVCAQLGLGIEPAPSQVVARDRHAQLV